MRTFKAFLLFAALAAGCKASGKAAPPPGCGSDSDCKGDRVCEAGRCVTPPPPLSPIVEATPDAGFSLEQQWAARESEEKLLCEEREARFQAQLQIAEERRRKQFEDFARQVEDLEGLHRKLETWKFEPTTMTRSGAHATTSAPPAEPPPPAVTIDAGLPTDQL